MSGFVTRVRELELTSGTFLNLGSSVTAEIAGNAGFDWVLVDMEHGAGDYGNLLTQLQAISATPAASIVRVPWHEPWQFKRVLDLGADGIMAPYVNTAEEARQAVRSMRYPPEGMRGVAVYNRACRFGARSEQYMANANRSLLTIVQIETPSAVEQAGEIAAIEGVDVLFVGPSDLSVSLGVPRQFQHPDYRAAVAKVIQACREHGKPAGILLGGEGQIEGAIADGFSFIGIGSDGGAAMSGLYAMAAAVNNKKA